MRLTSLEEAKEDLRILITGGERIAKAEQPDLLALLERQPDTSRLIDYLTGTESGQDPNLWKLLYKSQRKTTQVQDALVQMILPDSPPEHCIKINEILDMAQAQKELVRQAVSLTLGLHRALLEKGKINESS